jgi:hypothetical protein
MRVSAAIVLNARASSKDFFEGGCTVVRHGQLDPYYKKILSGDFSNCAAPAKAIADGAPLAADVDSGAEEHARVPTSSHASDAGLDFDMEAELELLLAGDDEVALAEDAGAGAEGPAMDAIVHDGAVLEDEHVPVELAEEAPPLIEDVKKGSFGAFTFTPRSKDHPKGGRFGAWEVRCPFHKLNPKSGCAKHFGVEGPTFAHQVAAGRRAAWWCTVARNYDRQRKHMLAFLADLVGDPPTDEELIAPKITVRPKPKDILDDVALDELDAHAHVEPPALADVPHGRGRGRGGRVGRARGRGRHAAIAAPAAPPASGDEMPVMALAVAAAADEDDSSTNSSGTSDSDSSSCSQSGSD